MTLEQIYEGRPDKKEKGSSGYSNFVNLYNTCERLQPELIIESGTWKGNSSWLFHHFADVICHDLQFATLMWRHPSIAYIKEDISEWTYGTEVNTLFYFDDHISQLDRLKWLIDGGHRYAVFDDNQPRAIADTLKRPPMPTLQVLMDEGHPIMKELKEYVVLPYHGSRANFDTRLTFIEL